MTACSDPTDDIGSPVVLTASAAEMASSTVTLPADTDTVGPPHAQEFYNARLTRVEMPWTQP